MKAWVALVCGAGLVLAGVPGSMFAAYWVWEQFPPSQAGPLSLVLLVAATAVGVVAGHFLFLAYMLRKDEQ